jgi:hypothetical protein
MASFVLNSGPSLPTPYSSSSASIADQSYAAILSSTNRSITQPLCEFAPVKHGLACTVCTPEIRRFQPAGTPQRSKHLPVSAGATGNSAGNKSRSF